jgi:glyoxylase-like metal-dependent hydrolase (beta-lactamase superfamily II)
MHRWRVGEVEVVRIEHLDFALPSRAPVPRWAVPDLAPSTDEYRVAFSALAVRDGDTRLVLDPWLQTDRDHPDAAAEAARLLDDLETAGFPAGEVDLVVHSHLEGIGWSTRPGPTGWELSFPNARYLFPADEIAAVERGEPLPGIDDFVHLASLTTIEAVRSGRRLTASVSVEPTTGHSVGHQVVRIDDGRHLAIYLGHLLIHPLQLVDPGTNPVDDGDDAAAERHRYLGELADRDGLLLTTLVGGSGGGVVARRDDGYRV